MTQEITVLWIDLFIYAIVFAFILTAILSLFFKKPKEVEDLEAVIRLKDRKINAISDVAETREKWFTEEKEKNKALKAKIVSLDAELQESIKALKAEIKRLDAEAQTAKDEGKLEIIKEMDK